MTIYFISDLHLKEENLENTNLFFKFLDTHGSYAKAIYILGDFFDTWIGDDYNTPFIWSIKNALTELDKNNVAVFFMQGNRDFLISEKFFQETHCQPISIPYVIELNTEKILLMHGDQLITADKEYGIFRNFVQNPIVKSLFLHLPQKLRLRIVNKIRNNSESIYKRKLQKKQSVFDVSQVAIENWIKRYQATTIIHGHIHKPGEHNFIMDNKICKRFVLGDWGRKATILAYRNNTFELIDIVNSAE